MDDFLNTIFTDKLLDENQIKAVISESKSLMILAGAGSGKTTTVAAKIKYLVKYKNIDPEKILVISFTNKAVSELDDIVNKEFKLNVKVNTFHKLGYELLKKEYQGYNLIEDKEKVVNNIVNSYNLNNIDQSLYKYIDAPYLIKKLKLLNMYKNINPNLLNKLKSYLNRSIYQFKDNKEGRAYKKFYCDINNEYLIYKQNNKLIDFDDMINMPNPIESNYEYIIVDEYQDIAKDRYELINKISLNKTLIVVGDDWQSIFKFANSDVNIFYDFLKRKNVELIKIINTYRNSQELINIAGSFVMKNEKHLKKELISNKHLMNPIKLIKYKNITKELTKVLDSIKETDRILILGRYSFDINLILNKNYQYINNKIVSKKHPNLNIDYLTVHAAKGLGYDQVIVINMKKGKYGFPSQKKDLPFVINDIDEEERRLFYVAITRTKNYTYLLYPNKNKSEYIDELKKY